LSETEPSAGACREGEGLFGRYCEAAGVFAAACAAKDDSGVSLDADFHIIQDRKERQIPQSRAVPGDQCEFLGGFQGDLDSAVVPADAHQLTARLRGNNRSDRSGLFQFIFDVIAHLMSFASSIRHDVLRSKKKISCKLKERAETKGK
jgi:hypothetical protein